MKIIRVESCDQCPKIREETNKRSGGYSCGGWRFLGYCLHIIAQSPIPSWCPLEDMEEVEHDR